MTAEPLAYGLLRSVERSAAHMEMRDAYTPDDPDWLDWQAGHRFDPADRWASWSGLVRATVDRGVNVRRVRLVSEPVTDYVRFEYDVTALQPAPLWYVSPLTELVLSCRQVRVRYLRDGRESAQCQGMMTFTELAPAASDLHERSLTGCEWQ